MQIAVIWQSGIFIYILVLKGKALLPYAAKQYSKKKKSLKLDSTLHYVMNKLIHPSKFGDGELHARHQIDSHVWNIIFSFSSGFWLQWQGQGD